MPKIKGNISRTFDREIRKFTLNQGYCNSILYLQKRFNIDIEELMSRIGRTKIREQPHYSSWTDTNSAKVLLDYLQEIGHQEQFEIEFTEALKKLSTHDIVIKDWQLLWGVCSYPYMETRMVHSFINKLRLKRKTAEDNWPIIGMLRFSIEMAFISGVQEGRDSIQRAFYYDKDSTESIKDWKKQMIELLLNDHLYIDITNLTIDDVNLLYQFLTKVERLSRYFPDLKRGRPKGTLSYRHEVFHNFTWSEIRECIRMNPRELTRFENEYVNEYGKGNPKLRRKAIQNFYKQVVIHRDMQDLGLRIRNRGRPRKTGQ